MSFQSNGYSSFFTKATGHAPYPYQTRFAESSSLPQVLNVATGTGKTAAVILGWIYRRRFAVKSVQNATPRRLIYCLPMRTLVEQTQNATAAWLKKLNLTKKVGVHLLMGGEETLRWDEHPEQDAILIGTQDMLLSRALNRGYGMSRYRWPVHFAMLNNDALWVLDETQLMGVGLTTSVQLQGLRDQLNTYGTCQTLWMSATLDLKRLQTVDHSNEVNSDQVLTLNEEDRSLPTVQKLIDAKKPLLRSSLQFTSETKGSYKKELAKNVVDLHKAGTLTLVVLNRVGRVQELFQEVKKLYKKAEDAPELHLIHSRFRPSERSETQSIALDETTIAPNGAGRIIIATQAIEAGVDLSATTLISELAPWSSMVQRFGRCNRRGTCGNENNEPASVYWIDIETTAKSKTFALPYEADQLDASREHLSTLEDAGLSSLKTILHEEVAPIVHVLRKKDLLDLFDTTSDLAGNDLDVSRYIRDSEDTDVQLFWREGWDEEKKETPDNKMPLPGRDELCSVPISALKGKSGFVKKSHDKKFSCYSWNSLDAKWETVNPNSVRPGMTLLLHKDAGGYDDALGWTGDAKHKPSVDSVDSNANQLNENLANSFMDKDDWGNQPLTLEKHLQDVAECAVELQTQLKSLDDNIAWGEIITAAWWHDVGKSHAAFQTAMRDFETLEKKDPDQKKLWAKSGGKEYPKYRIKEGDQEILRTGFRHELASALAWLSQHDGEERANLIAYLIASHHGKVRISIRSMPNENRPTKTDVKFARGVWDGDTLPEVTIGNGETFSGTEINLDLMQLGESEGGQSWLSRTLELRETHGPFRLAFLESMVRISDWLGSKKGEKNNDN